MQFNFETNPGTPQKPQNYTENTEVCWVNTDYPNSPKEITFTSNFINILWIGMNGMYQYHSNERVDKNDEFHSLLEKILSYSS